MTVPTRTAVPARRPAARLTWTGGMQTATKPCSAASSITRRTSGSVASGRRRVWSMWRASSPAVMGKDPESADREGHALGVDGHPGELDSGVVVEEDVLVGVAALGHAVGADLAHADPVSP